MSVKDRDKMLNIAPTNSGAWNQFSRALGARFIHEASDICLAGMSATFVDRALHGNTLARDHAKILEDMTSLHVFLNKLLCLL